MRSCIS